MLSETDQGFSSSTLEKFWNNVSEWNRGPLELLTLQEQRQEGDEEDQENGDDAVLDPIEDRDEVVAARLSTEHIPLRVDLTNGQLLVERTEV